MDQAQQPIPNDQPNSLSEISQPKSIVAPLLSGFRVAILYSDAKREYFATEEHYLTEAEVFDRVKLITPYLEKMGAEVVALPGNNNLGDELRKLNPGFVLNLVDSVRGDETLAPSVPGLLELLDLSYTGSGILGMSINYNKFLTKKLMEQRGLPVPRYQLMNAWTDTVNPLLRYPLISKLNSIHGSVEIDDTAVTENERQLRERVKRLMTVYKDDVLIEEFIAGRELAAVVFEGMKRKVYVGEKVFNQEIGGQYKISSFSAVWQEDELDKSKWTYNYSKYEPNEALKEDIKKCYEVLKMEDYAKLDIRLDQSGRYYFIDPNANPAFGPKESFCALGTIMDLYGIDFTQILKRLAINTLNGSLIQANGEAAAEN
ncbi:hypothetical protein HYU89_04465 [Candidatus Collierbacteria bacterium]|nr:hypothetical protein [Candidatus Collierbacteria bacterium]